MSEINQRVSVVIPTYKRETKYLSRAIASIENQTHKNTEIVVIDDNPSDSDYRKQVMKFMQRFDNDPYVIYIRNPKNIGGSLARNNGINVATGDYITFLDDDDEYLPKKIEKQLKFMKETDCDMSFTNFKSVTDKYVVVDYRDHRGLKNFDNMTLMKYHIMRHLTGTPTFMYKAAKLKEIGGFEDAKMGQEFYLMLKSIEGSLNIRYLNRCDVIIHKHAEGGISQGRNKIDGENALFNFKKKYFHIFTIREKMFIRFRHYVVMGVAYKRNSIYFRSFTSILCAFVVSPIDFLYESTNFILSIFRNREVGNKK